MDAGSVDGCQRRQAGTCRRVQNFGVISQAHPAIAEISGCVDAVECRAINRADTLAVARVRCVQHADPAVKEHRIFNNGVNDVVILVRAGCLAQFHPTDAFLCGEADR